MNIFPGRFHDGVTAAEHRVAVTVAADGLEIQATGLRAFWRVQDIELLSKQSGAWRFASGDARLTIERSKEAEAALKSVRILDPRRDALRAGGLIGGLVALSAALGLIVFVGIPMAAEPLARATPRHVEEQFGVNIARQINVFMRPCENTEAADAAIAPMIEALVIADDPGFPITLRFVHQSSPNALAVAGGQVMVTSGLLETLESPDELAAVIAHELGHVKARDSMIALYRNAGLGILLELITGGSGVAQQVILLGGQLTELSYTRRQEARADVTAVAMLRGAGLDPAALARAFERLKAFGETKDAEDGAEKRNPSVLDKASIPEWFKSHPDLDSRIANARKHAAPATATALSDADWQTVRAACSKKT